MARLQLWWALGFLGTALVAAADDATMLRGASEPADRQQQTPPPAPAAQAAQQGRECPPGRCPRITCIPEAQMAQKKCGMASNMCPAGFCAAVGDCTSCSRRSLFSEDNDRNWPFFGFSSFVPTPGAVDKSTSCPNGLCVRVTCVPEGGSIGFCGDSPFCPKGQCPINGECVQC